MNQDSAVLIDRDGTMGYDKMGENFVRPWDYCPYDCTKPAFEKLHRHGIPVIIITNQSSIARHLADGYDFAEEFRQIGADDWFICPHDKQDACGCRKPKTGLIQQARDKHHLCLEKCYMVGDRWSDMAAGGQMKMRLVPVKTGFGMDTLEKDRYLWKEYKPVYIAKDVMDAALWIIDDIENGF